MFTDVKFFDYLVQLGAETADTVKKLTEKDGVAAYEGLPDAENDARVWENYKKAVEACRIWMQAVLAVEAAEDKRSDISAEAALFLPDRLLEVSISTTGLPFDGASNADTAELLITPIGRMNYFTYRAILDVPDNPVKVLYRYFQDMLHYMHIVLTMPIHADGQDDLLNKSILKYEGIVDVLGVHRYDSLWYNVEEFFSDPFAEKETS